MKLPAKVAIALLVAELIAVLGFVAGCYAIFH